MVELPPSEFTFGKYGGEVISWEVLKSTTNYVKWLLKQNIIGYCNSMSIEIRPRTDNMAIMIEQQEGWQDWFHVPIGVWKEFLKQKEKIENEIYNS